MNVGFALAIALLLALLLLGVLGSIWTPQDHKDFFNVLQLWLGNSGLLMYVFVFALLAVLCFFAPLLVREVGVAVQNLSRTAATIETIARKFNGSTQVVDFLKSVVNTVPDSTKAGLVRSVLNAFTK